MVIGATGKPPAARPGRPPLRRQPSHDRQSYRMREAEKILAAAPAPAPPAWLQRTRATLERAWARARGRA